MLTGVGRGGFRGGTISWGGEILPLQNLAVSAGAGAHAGSPAGLPTQGSLGRVGAFIHPWPSWALLECRWEDGAPPWRSPIAALCRLQPVAWPALGNARVWCPILPIASFLENVS